MIIYNRVLNDWAESPTDQVTQPSDDVIPPSALLVQCLKIRAEERTKFSTSVAQKETL